MDKRTLLYVITISIVIFCVNIFFTYQEQERNREWYTQQNAIREEQIAEVYDEVIERTAKVQELPFISLYSDKNGEELEGYGILASSGKLTLIPAAKTLPETLYSESGQAFERQQFSGDPQIALYGEGSIDAFKMGSLTPSGKIDIFVLNKDQNETPIVALGEVRGGEITFPLFDEPQVLSLAFVRSGREVQPIGVYNPQQKEVVELEGKKERGVEVEVVKGLPAEEKFFVLENSYQQLVFSSVGGALVEVNLPFRSQENRESVVREIEFDRKMVEQSAQNARFPLVSYRAEDGEHQIGALGGYYPLIRRDLVDEQSGRRFRIEPKFYALNIVSNYYPELAELSYTVKEFSKDQIVFEAKQRHRRITKTYSFEKGAPYCLNLEVKVEGDAGGLWLTSGIPGVEWMSGASTPILKCRKSRGNKVEVEKIDPSKPITDIQPDWICNSNGFLGLIIDPLTAINPGYKVETVSGDVAPSRLLKIDQEQEIFQASKLPGYNMLLPLNSKGKTMKFRVYAGPFAEATLKAVDARFADPVTGVFPDYKSSMTFHGWFSFISQPFARFLFMLMNFFHAVTGSWAVAIILLTAALKVMLYPLNSWSMKSMRKMQQIAPKVQAVQEKYKKDPTKAQMEVMKLYKESGANPLSGCFPLLIQMPFLFGMFDLLRSTFELRGASFVPGWIDDLTAPDVLFTWNFSIPFIGNELHLLPFILGGVMFLQSKLMSPKPATGAAATEQQKQQQMMTSIMPVFMTFMFYRFPSGLNLYWLFSTIFGIIQQWLVNKSLGEKPQVELKAATGK